ncbi:hypothetical protein Sros01_36920 [Streptomyces roseochromogenus]|nr:hypothetical protein Sros01_36920 [Streptomyces roseochromogenus]
MPTQQAGSPQRAFCRGGGSPSRSYWVPGSECAVRGNDPLFCTRTGRRLSSDAVAQRLSARGKTAARTFPSLLDKGIYPHVLRHSCAMS